MNIKPSVAVVCFLPGRAKDLSAPMFTGLHAKCSLFLSDFNGTLIFMSFFRKILHYDL